MASACDDCKSPIFLPLFFVLILSFGWESCYSQRTLGFDVHHRFSDTIKQIFPLDHLPEKGSLDYYRALTHRDRFIHGRRLSSTSTGDQILTFGHGNTTYRMSSLGFLYYANVSLGAPSVNFFVALDTGSDLFWVPCDCISCAHSMQTSSGDVINLNIYSPNASLTSKEVPCNSSLCEQQDQCLLLGQRACPYQVVYLTPDTSTSGYLVEDFLHLTTDNINPTEVDAPISFGAGITFGCGQVETGSFLDGAAINGLFGLGLGKVSVPSILSNSGLTANSFSMCFGPDGIGRINFGDKGSPDQAETSFNINPSHPTYNISVTQITVGKERMNVSFTAIFDTGTSFTYLNDPAYTQITQSFSAQVHDKRKASDADDAFEYCYEPSSTSSVITIPSLNLTMGGGSQFPVNDPIVVFVNGNTISYYCLAVVKSSDVNIIGQNFMTGYLIVFDREKSVLGWIESDCYSAKYTSTTNTPSSSSVAPPPETHSSTTAPPPPETHSSTTAPPPTQSHSSSSVAPPPETHGSTTSAPPSQTHSSSSVAPPPKTHGNTTAAPPSQTPSSSSVAPPPETHGSPTTAPPTQTPSSSPHVPSATAVQPESNAPEAAKKSGKDSSTSGAPSASVQWSLRFHTSNGLFLLLLLVLFSVI